MRRSTAGRFAVILALLGTAVSVPGSLAHAQSLFGNNAARGRNQPSATVSNFSRIGIPQPPGAREGQSGGFIGRSNRGFVGNRAASQSGGEGNTVRGSAQPRRSVNTAQNASPPARVSGPRETLPGTARRRTIVPRHRIAFEFAAREATEISGTLQQQLENLAARNPAFARINVDVDSAGRVILQGQVPSENTRKLAAIMVRLEPGVRAVQNELAIEADHD